MLFALPSDIWLQILLYLRLHDLLSVRLLSREAHRFFVEHEDSIYYQAAVHHRLTQSRTALEDAVRAAGDWMSGVREWKEFCRRWTILERNWDGRGRVYEGGYHSDAESVTSFAVDEQQRTFITTTRTGGLSVRALEDNRLLWALSKEYVGTRSVEFSEGFLIILARHSGLEIWRRTTDVQADQPPLLSRGRVVTTPVQYPSLAAVRDFQLQAASFAPVEKDSDRGTFLPHAYISTSVGPIRFYRAKFPLLVYIGFNAPDEVTVTDIPSGESVWTVAIDTGRVLGMSPSYSFPRSTNRTTMGLDLSKTHVLVCTDSAVVVVKLPEHCVSAADGARRDGDTDPDMLVLSDMDTPIARQTHACQLESFTKAAGAVPKTFTRTAYPVVTTPTGREAFESFRVLHPSEHAQRANMHALVPTNGPRPSPIFVSARFSPDGRHIAAGTAFDLIYLAWDFERVEKGMTFSEITEYLYVKEPLSDICWDTHTTRLAFRTAWGEVYLLSFNKAYRALPGTGASGTMTHGTMSTPPSILRDTSVLRVRDFVANTALREWARGQGIPRVGLQMTRTTLWLAWDLWLLARAAADRDGSRLLHMEDLRSQRTGFVSVCFIDFSPDL